MANLSVAVGAITTVSIAPNSPEAMNPANALSSAFGYGYGADKGQIGVFFTAPPAPLSLNLLANTPLTVDLFKVKQDEGLPAGNPPFPDTPGDSKDHYFPFEGTGGFGSVLNGIIQDPKNYLHVPLSLSIQDGGETKTLALDATVANGGVKVHDGQVSDPAVDYELSYPDQALMYANGDTVSIHFLPLALANNPQEANLQATFTFKAATPPAAPVYSIANAADVVEGGKLVFTVTGTAAGSQDVTVTTDQGNVLIKAGQTTGTLEVQTLDNTTFGPNPDVTVSLTGTNLGSIDAAAKTAIGHVIDNDTAPPTEHLNAVFRFFDTKTQDHFYTTSAVEKDFILKTQPTYNYEGAQWSTPDDGPNTIDVFRFFDSAHNSHFYTTSVAERDFVIQTQPSYKYEGVAFEAYANASAAGSGALTLERFFNTNTGLHHYSASASETNGIKQGAAGPGWIDEGPSFIVHVPADGMLNA